jgi:ectoine hydroxylase-related dioxygenase (phytanoyl-CoA dioxygenase family)
VQLCVQAGDAALFPHALWHGYVTNRSSRTRKSLIYCYSQQCFRAFDYQRASPELLARCTLRQRRLIGDIGAWKYGSYFYSPSDQEALIRGIEPEPSA